jgi:hypothetical protein
MKPDNRNIPPSETRRKRWSRKPKYRDQHGPRIAHDRTTIMLTLDQRQAALAGQMAKALEALRRHLLDFRDDMHIKDGRFPSLGQFGQAAREWNKKQPRDTVRGTVRGTVQGRTTRSSSARVLPQGALDATARLVLQRSISASADAAKRREQRRATMGALALRFARQLRPRHDDDEPDWDQQVYSIFFTGGGTSQRIKIKDRRLYLPKLGWCPYHSKENKGDVLAAVLETPGTRIRGATLKLSQGGEYRAVISFEAAPGKLIQQEIAKKAPGALIHRYTQQDMTWVAARKLVVEKYISPAAIAAYTDPVFEAAMDAISRRVARSQGLTREAAEKLVYSRYGQGDAAIIADLKTLGWEEPVDEASALLRLFRKPDGWFQRVLAVSTIKKAVKDYKATRKLLREYDVRPKKRRIGPKGQQRVAWVYDLSDITDVVNRRFS